MQYILIDGNNLAIRSAFANDYMKNKQGVSSGAHYGFFNSLLNLKKRFPAGQFLVAWDSSSKRRREESREAVKKGLIKEAYKANRKKGEIAKPLQDWFETGDHLKRALGTVGIPQIKVDGFEADDVIASYADKLKVDHDVVIVTSDKDFYQLLDDNVVVWDGMKEDFFTKKSFSEEYGISPEQHVHVGALSGDTGDNIFGVPGWGDKTAIKAIKEHGTWQKVLEYFEEKHGKHRKDYPDFCDDHRMEKESCADREKVFQELCIEKTPKEKIKYPGIYWGQPYSGLLEPFHLKKLKIPKTELMALMFQDRVKLAYSLKAMDRNIENLPEITPLNQNKNKLLEYFGYYDIVSLEKRVDVLFNQETVCIDTE